MTARAVKGSQPVSTASLAWLPRIRSSSTRNGPRTNQPQAGLAVACASATEESTPPQLSTPATSSSLFSPERLNQAATINPHTSTSPIPTDIAGRPDCHERSYVRKAPRTATSTAMPSSIPAGKDRVHTGFRHPDQLAYEEINSEKPTTPTPAIINSPKGSPVQTCMPKTDTAAGRATASQAGELQGRPKSWPVPAAPTSQLTYPRERNNVPFVFRPATDIYLIQQTPRRVPKPGAPYMLTLGSQSNQEGRYQLSPPRRAMLAGTITIRTMVASSKTAMASPKPTCWTITSRPAAKVEKMTTMISAAPVIIRPVFLNPMATDSSFLPVSLKCSRMRLRRKTW